MKNCVEHIFTGETCLYFNYDSGKTTLGSLMRQNAGSNSIDKYVSTIPIGIARPMEADTTIAGAYPFAIDIGNNLFYVFMASSATNVTYGRFLLYIYNSVTSEFAWQGFINTNLAGGNITVRGFRATRDLYAVGTASVNGTSVSGTGTYWQTERISTGARIGFGSTNPHNITTWYQISAINNDGSLTISGNAGVITSGPYVIEEIRIITAVTNATLTNGGLFIVKGLNPSSFTVTGTTFTLSNNSDNLQGLYWLKDASTVTNTISWGVALDSKENHSEQYAYIPNGSVSAGGAKIYKYNIRAPLTVAGGISTSAYVFTTGTNPSAFTGTVQQGNNGRIATLSHGIVSGIKSLYFCTSTRIYQVSVSSIVSGGNFSVDNVMVALPPGGTNTYPAASIASLEYADSIDYLIVCGSAGNRSYFTKFRTDSTPFDIIFQSEDRQYDQTSADSGGVIHPTMGGTVFSAWAESGILFFCRNGTAATTNQIYSIPMKCHWNFATIDNNDHQRVITPSLSTIGATKFYRAYVNCVNSQLGTAAFGTPTEAIKTYYRTSGIEDNSGSWILLDDSRDLTGVSPSSSIQFMFEFKVFGTCCIPNRIYSLTVVYEDSSTDSHYQPSIGKSNVLSRIFAFRQGAAWGGNIANLRMRIYNASTGVLILDDTVENSSSGIWQYSTDGENWNSWDSSKDSVGNYIRYTASSLPGGISARALLTQ